MTTRNLVAPSSPHRRLTVAVMLAVAAVVAIVANTAIALAALAAGASSSFAPLTIAVYAPFTIAGLIGGYVGWRLVCTHARNPHGILAVLVPASLVLSFLPDTIAMIIGFIPGGSVTAYVGLMLMHVVVVAVGVPVFRRLAPAAPVRA